MNSTRKNVSETLPSDRHQNEHLPANVDSKENESINRTHNKAVKKQMDQIND